MATSRGDRATGGGNPTERRRPSRTIRQRSDSDKNGTDDIGRSLPRRDQGDCLDAQTHHSEE
ncbi:hypothetical protein CBS101457_000160 [Exobasidium rhododendri]|nr:hypothetical protein CBS101457_000160 [Exobasidium rhododendri]